VNLITPNQNHEQKLPKIFKLKQVKFLTKTRGAAAALLLEQPPQLQPPQLQPSLLLVLPLLLPPEHQRLPEHRLLPMPEHLPLLIELLPQPLELLLIEHLLLEQLLLLLQLEQLLQLRYSQTVHGIDVTCFVGC